jgi:hypothetical protein
MTAQISEILHYQGRKQRMCTEPLGDYFALAGITPGFEFSSTALWRGYVGEWDILSLSSSRRMRWRKDRCHQRGMGQ